jgi:hypothetical protein
MEGHGDLIVGAWRHWRRCYAHISVPAGGIHHITILYGVCRHVKRRLHGDVKRGNRGVGLHWEPGARQWRHRRCLGGLETHARRNVRSGSGDSQPKDSKPKHATKTSERFHRTILSRVEGRRRLFLRLLEAMTTA